MRAFRHERQACWLEGMEGAFHRSGSVPEEVCSTIREPSCGTTTR